MNRHFKKATAFGIALALTSCQKPTDPNDRKDTANPAAIITYPTGLMIALTLCQQEQLIDLTISANQRR